MGDLSSAAALEQVNTSLDGGVHHVKVGRQRANLFRNDLVRLLLIFNHLLDQEYLALERVACRRLTLLTACTALVTTNLIRPLQLLQL